MKPQTLDALEAYFPDAADYERETIVDLFALSDLVDDIERRIRALAEQTGMPSLHFFLLEHLALNDGAMSLGDLIAALNLPKQSATYVVDRLEKDGLVERRMDARDRRRFEVALTDNGRLVVRDNLGHFYGAMLRAMEAIAPDDRRVLLQSLTRFRSGLGEAHGAIDSSNG